MERLLAFGLWLCVTRGLGCRFVVGCLSNANVFSCFSSNGFVFFPAWRRAVRDGQEVGTRWARGGHEVDTWTRLHDNCDAIFDDYP